MTTLTDMTLIDCHYEGNSHIRDAIRAGANRAWESCQRHWKLVLDTTQSPMLQDLATRRIAECERLMNRKVITA